LASWFCLAALLFVAVVADSRIDNDSDIISIARMTLE
jgi:hypothetical protein